jgi:hypothetical protein
MIITPHRITSPNRLGFNAQDYSKFKFGSKKVAKKFGFELADVFINNLCTFGYDDLVYGKQIVICSSPFCFIPTATYAMKDYFVYRLNMWLKLNGYPVVQETKIHRTITYKEDYGGLSAEERMKLIAKDDFHIDKAFVAGKTVLFLDDIRITGSHEKVIERMIKQFDLASDYHFLYYGVLDSNDIHPSIENDLNYAFVKNLLDLDKIIKNEDFLLNTRVVKYLLNYKEGDFKIFINYQKKLFLDSLYHSAIGNSYHLIEDYKENFNYLETLINQ